MNALSVAYGATPLSPILLEPSAAINPATWVPWESSIFEEVGSLISSVVLPSSKAVSALYEFAKSILFFKSSCSYSTPSSTTLTWTPLPTIPLAYSDFTSRSFPPRV